MRILFCILAVLLFVVPARGDGEKDNHPDKVRRIPRDGIQVSAEREQSLRRQLQVLQGKIGALERSSKSMVAGLLPDALALKIDAFLGNIIQNRCIFIPSRPGAQNQYLILNVGFQREQPKTNPAI